MPLVKCPDCGSDVSTLAAACPNCGRPTTVQPQTRNYVTPPTSNPTRSTPRKSHPLLLGCGAVIGLLVLFAVISSQSNHETTSSSVAPAAATDDLRARATNKLKSDAPWGDTAASSRLCQQADLTQVSAEVKAKCASSHLAFAKDLLKKNNPAGARQALNTATAEGLASQQIQSIEPAIAKAEAAAERQRRRSDAAGAALARQVYGKALREKYLDDGLDIKVRVTGSESDHITLEFSLFNDVWAHKLQKGDLLTEMKNLGFKRVDLTDNYDYHVYWTLKK